MFCLLFIYFVKIAHYTKDTFYVNLVPTWRPHVWRSSDMTTGVPDWEPEGKRPPSRPEKKRLDKLPNA